MGSSGVPPQTSFPVLDGGPPDYSDPYFFFGRGGGLSSKPTIRSGGGALFDRRGFVQCFERPFARSNPRPQNKAGLQGANHPQNNTKLQVDLFKRTVRFHISWECMLLISTFKDKACKGLG